jgi:hypothetical protein
MCKIWQIFALEIGKHAAVWYMDNNFKIDLKSNGMGVHELDSSRSGQGQMASFCEHGNKPLVIPIKCKKFLE